MVLCGRGGNGFPHELGTLRARARQRRIAVLCGGWAWLWRSSAKLTEMVMKVIIAHYVHCFVFGLLCGRVREV
jgi:hypothetical protein